MPDESAHLSHGDDHTRICNTCGVLKQTNEFNAAGPPEKLGQCKQCAAEARKATRSQS